MSALGAIVDSDLDKFKEELFNKPVGELMSLKNLLSLEYNRVKSAFNELTDKALKEGKQNDTAYVETLQGMNLVMFRLEQKILFLQDRISDLRID